MKEKQKIALCDTTDLMVYGHEPWLEMAGSHGHAGGSVEVYVKWGHNMQTDGLARKEGMAALVVAQFSPGRLYFMYDRRLLVKLSQCAWKVLSVYLKQGVSLDDPNPGAVIAVQTFGDFLNFNPHLHIIATDGCFYGNGVTVGPRPNPSDLEAAFRLEVFKMLKKEEKITDFIIENMMSWHHSGINVYFGEAIWPSDQEGIERLAQYIDDYVLQMPYEDEYSQLTPYEDCI